jgi:hypothetical protein
MSGLVKRKTDAREEISTMKICKSMARELMGVRASNSALTKANANGVGAFAVKANISAGNWSSYREPAAPHRQPLDVPYPLREGQAQDDVRVAYGRKYWWFSATITQQI